MNNRDYNRNYSNNSGSDLGCFTFMVCIGIILIICGISVQIPFFQDSYDYCKKQFVGFLYKTKNKISEEMQSQAEKNKKHKLWLESLTKEELVKEENKNKISNFKDEDWCILLNNALKNDDVEYLKVMVQVGFNIKTELDYSLNTPLFFALKESRNNIARWLIEHKADINSLNRNKDTLLHIAAQTNNLEMVNVALEKGLNADIKNKKGISPLWLAAKNNNREICWILSKNSREKETMAKVATDTELVIFFKTGKARWKKGNDVLFSKDGKQLDGHWSDIKKLIKNGKLSELFDNIQQGVDLTVVPYGEDPAPCLAARYGKIEIMKYLLEVMDCKNQVTEHGNNALLIAISQKNFDLVELLLNKGFDPNSTDNYNNSALHYAVVRCPFPDFLNILLKYGANPNVFNKNNQSPLHFAIKNCNVQGIRLLLQKNNTSEYINAPDYEGNTALHYVAKYDASANYVLDEIYKYYNKLDFSKKNLKGETPRNINGRDKFEWYEKRHRKTDD